MKKWLILVIFAAFTQIADAAILSLDYAATGDNLITKDTTTGLEWLDLSATRGLSAAEVLSGFGGWINSFRYATHAEVIALLGQFGLEDTRSFRTDYYSDTLRLNTLFNTQSDTCYTIFSSACGFFLSDTPQTIDKFIVGTQGNKGIAEVDESTGYYDWKSVMYGSLLVRQGAQVPDPTNVPEPVTPALLGLGLLGLAAVRRRKM